MRTRIVRVLVVLAILIIYATPALADTQVTITVTAVPLVSSGITDFLITYVNDQRVDFTYVLGANVKNIMIREKDGAYPANIPDINTTPSDGRLIYYGNALAASDTGMNFDQNPYPLYYRAWAQLNDDTWVLTTSDGWKESKQLLLLFLGLFAIGVTALGYAFKRSWIKLFAIIAWWMVGLYLYFNFTSFGSVPQGTYLMIPALATIGLGFDVLHRESKKTTPEGMDTDDDGLDEQDREYQSDYAKYQKQTAVYHTKRKRPQF